MKLNETKKRKRSNPYYVIEKNYVKDNEKKNFSVFHKRNHENWPTPLQAFANEMMKENKNISTVPVQIKVDNKDWTVNVSTTVVSQSKSSSEFPRNREALFKSLKEESYRLLKLVSKKNSIRNDVRMVFDPNENRITPFHIDFKKGDSSNDKGVDNLDMTKFLSSDVEDSDDDISNSDMSVCNGHDSIGSPVSVPNVEYPGVKVSEVHSLIDEESNELDTFHRRGNEVDTTLHLSLKQCNTNAEGMDSELLCSNKKLLTTSCGPEANSEISPENGFKNELNDVLYEGPSQIVALSKSHDNQHASDLLEEEVNQNTPNEGTDILCLSDINHLGEEIMVKNELDQQVLPKKIIDQETGSVVHIEVFDIEDNRQRISAKSEEGTENHNRFESEYIIPEIDFVDSSGFRCSNEKINVSVSFHTDSSNSSYDFDSDPGVNLTEDEVSGMHSNDTSQDVSEEYNTKPNEELVLLDNELPSSSLQGSDSDVKGEKDPLSIDGFTGGVLFYDPETDYDNRDVYSSDKNESCSNEKNVHLSDNNENGISDNTQESNEENSDDFCLSNKWNWSNLKKYNSKTTQNDLTKIRNSNCKEHVNNQSKENERFLGFSDCTDSSSKYCDFVSACSKLGYYDDMVILNQHYEVIPPNKKSFKFLHSGTSGHDLSKAPLTANGDHSNAILLKKKISEVKTQRKKERTFVKSEIVNNHKSNNDPEDVFLGFKSNDNYTEFRRKSIEMSRRLSEEFSDGKNQTDQSLNSTVENISSFVVVENEENTGTESSIGNCNLDKCKVSSNEAKLMEQSLEQDASMTHNRNSNLFILNADSKKEGSKAKSRSASMDSVPKKRGRPRKNQFTTTNMVNGILNQKENTDATLKKLNFLESDVISIVNQLPNQSAKEQDQPSLIVSSEDKTESNSVLLKSPASTLTDLIQCINGGQANTDVSYDEVKEISYQSGDDVSLISNGSSFTCTPNRDLNVAESKENTFDNSVESVPKKRGRPKKNQSQLVTSSSTYQDNVTINLFEGNTDIEVKELEHFQNEDISVVNDLPKCVEQESTPILATNIDHESENLRYRDQGHNSVINASLTPVENKENILSTPVESVSRKRGRPKKNQCQSVISNATILCNGTLDLKEENIEDEESNHFDNNDESVNELPNWTAKEQTPISITNNDNISILSKSSTSKLTSFSHCMNSTQEGSNALCEEIIVLSQHSEQLSPSVPGASSFENEGNILIASNESVPKKRGRPRKNPVHLIASTPTKPSCTLYLNGKNTNTEEEESSHFDNKESIVNSTADEHNLTASSFVTENYRIPLESVTYEENSSALKQEDIEHRPEQKLKLETTFVSATPLKRKPGRPPKRLSQSFQESEQLQKKSNNIYHSSLAIGESGNKSLLLNSATPECGPLSCERKDVDDKSKDILLIKKEDILKIPLKRKPGRPPKHLSLSFQGSEQLQQKSNNIFDSSSATSESRNKSLLLNSSATPECGPLSCEQKGVDDKSKDILVIKKEDFLKIPLKRKPGRPPKHLSLSFQGSEQFQKKSSKVHDSSLAISDFGNESLLLNSSTSPECGPFSYSEQKNVDDKSRVLLLIEKEDTLKTLLRRKPGRPPKHLSLSFQGSEQFQNKSSNVLDSSLATSDFGNESLLLNSSASSECGPLSRHGQKDVDDKSRDILLIEKEDILETPLKRKPGRPPKHLSLSFQGSEQFLKKSSNVPDSSLVISDFGNKSLLLNSSATPEYDQLSCNEQMDMDDRSRDIEKTNNLETPLEKKSGRSAEQLLVDRGEIDPKEINSVPVKNGVSSIFNSFSKEDRLCVHSQIKTDTNLKLDDQLQIRKIKSDIEFTSGSTNNKLENVSVLEKKIELENKTSSESILKRKPDRLPENLSISVNHLGFKLDQKENDEIHISYQSSCDIAEFNSFVFNSPTILESFPLSSCSENEEANFKLQNGVPIKNTDILGLPLKGKSGRPPKNLLLHHGEIKQCQIENKDTDSKDSVVDNKSSIKNSLCSMFSNETKENTHYKPDDKLLMDQKDCLEPPLKIKPDRFSKSLSICQQKIQSPVENENSDIFAKNLDLNPLSIKEVLHPEDANEKLEDEEINCSEFIIDKEPDKPQHSLFMRQQQIEKCEIESKNVSIKDSESFTNKRPLNSLSHEEGFSNVLQSTDANHELKVKEKNIVEPQLKRKPGRPPKRLSMTQQEIGSIKVENIPVMDSDKLKNSHLSNLSSNRDSSRNISHSKEDANHKLGGEEKNSFEPPPKRKPGRPPKRLSMTQLEIGKCQIESINIEDIPVSDSKRSLNSNLMNLFYDDNSLSNVSHSEENVKNKMAGDKKVSFEAPLKRKPGRPPKHLSVCQQDINLLQNKNHANQNVLIVDSSVTDYSGPAPKRRPGRPRKVSSELTFTEENVRNNSMHDMDHISVKMENERLFITDNNSFDVIPLQGRNETSAESLQCLTLPKRKPGRPRKVSLVVIDAKDNDLDESSDTSHKLIFERGDASVQSSSLSLESSVYSEHTPKRRPGRPRKYSLEPEVMRLGTIATSTPFANETASSLSFNSFADIELLDDCDTLGEEVPKKKRGRPKGCKVIRRSIKEIIHSETYYTIFNNDDSNLEISRIVPKQEIIPNIDSSSNLTLNSEDGCDNNVTETDLSQETECLNESDLSSKQKARIEKRKLLSGRVDSLTRLKNPNDKVKCALCGEIMAVIHYQKVHLLKHNFMSWLEGEEPLPIDDIDKMDTLLVRGKRANPKFIFRCEVCHQEKKSSKGLLSHRQFCGKSDKEREGMMVTCTYCGRLMMPVSLQPHIYQCHRTVTEPAPPSEESPGPVRKAAAKCLGKIASIIEENGLIKAGKDFHGDGDEEFDEIEEISLLYIPVQKKKTTKHLMNRWKQLAGDNKELHCIVPTCTFKALLVKDIVHHHKTCNADGSQGFSCIKCNYICKVEDEMREHVKSCNPPIMVSQSDNSEDEDHEKHVIIPYLKTAEQNLNVRYKVLFFKPALTWMKEIYEKYFTQEPLYPDLHLNIDLWEEMDPQTSQFYNPEISNSMMVSFQNSSWESMLALEGKVIEGNQGIAYTGGPVWGLEWCPGEGPQYLAVSSHLSMEFNFQAGSTFTGPGLVQLWSLEDISNAKSDSLSTLQFCYGVCHNDRACWNMAWCPSGGRTDTRIGLLALATTSGSIPIYAMPNPECLQYQSTRFYKPEPVLKLELWSNEKWQCSAISWSKIKPHNIIAAGFVNGMVAVWNLETHSKLLRKNSILYPFKVFQAHHSIITGVCLSPESDKYLATASYDKSFKYWDLIDTTAPHTILKRGLFTSVDWLRHWMSAVTTYDNAYTMMQTTVSLSSVRGFVNPTTPVITSINSTAWSVSVNDWLNGAITSYDNGQVVLFLALRQSIYQHLDKRKFSKVILNSTLHNIEGKDGPAEPNSKQKEKEIHNNNMPSNSYGDAIYKYGLSIRTDPDIGRSDKFQEKGSENVNDIYPLSSINRVAWNTNKNSFLYTAMGYQSGFLVVSKLSFNSKDFNLIEELSKL